MSVRLPLGTVAPDALVDARLQLHAAAQMVAWVGRRVLPPADGPIRAALFYDDRHGGMLAGAPLRPSIGGKVRAALAFDPPAILVLAGDDRTVRGRRPLTDTTIPDAWAWLTGALRWLGVETNRLAPPPADQVPTDELREGGRFEVDRASAVELGHWFGMAADLLAGQAASRGLDLAAPCWSHHFDMALVVALEGHGEAQVTLGFSPGDASIPEPYLYVLAWPFPDGLGALPEPPRPGRWQREGWTGLALPASLLLRTAAAGDPVPLARSFLDRGFEVARSLALSG